MNTTVKAAILTAVSALLAAGCASNPDKLDATYVSPLQYTNYDCQQIGTEQAHIERRTSELYTRLKNERQKDNAQMGVGLLLFWPALFFLEGGDGPEASEYARLKGEYEALRTVAVDKKCGLNFSDDLSETIKSESNKKS